MKNKWGLSLIILLVACAANPQHENFKQVMQRQVGKSGDDTDFYPALYRLKQMDSKRLPNGNLREEYAAGRGGKCKLYFETTPGERKVVGWSFEGDTGDCVIARDSR